MPEGIERVSIRWGRVGSHEVMLRFRVDGCRELVVPAANGGGRGDELWKTTCFELFLAERSGRYREFNFSPSGQWAAYAFDGYRTGKRDFDPVKRPRISVDKGRSVFTLTVFIDKAELDKVSHVSLCAVLEEQKEMLSYWAVRHPDIKPDFHNPACFVLPVAPAGGA
jgi:hypothetical protein